MRVIAKHLCRPLASPYWKHRVLAPEIADSAAISQALGVIRARWPETVSVDAVADDPVFLFAAGWGSGSTLLQRLIMSDQQIMLWGEPHDHAVPICRLAQMIAPVNDRWPRANYFSPLSGSTSLSEQWIANLSPQITAMQAAHRAFLRAWLCEPARVARRSRWGLKEVRLTADHARFLKWLFPKAKFVFLYRDVKKSFVSCRHVKWFSVWPEFRVSRASSFAHHWTHLVNGFLESEQELDAFIVKYESLIHGGEELRRLATYLGSHELDETVLDIKVGTRGGHRQRLSYREEAIIDAIAGPLRARLKYDQASAI